MRWHIGWPGYFSFSPRSSYSFLLNPAEIRNHGNVLVHEKKFDNQLEIEWDRLWSRTDSLPQRWMRFVEGWGVHPDPKRRETGSSSDLLAKRFTTNVFAIPLRTTCPTRACGSDTYSHCVLPILIPIQRIPLKASRSRTRMQGVRVISVLDLPVRYFSD